MADIKEMMHQISAFDMPRSSGVPVTCEDNKVSLATFNQSLTPAMLQQSLDQRVCNSEKPLFIDLAYHDKIQGTQGMPYLHGQEQTEAKSGVSTWSSYRAQKLTILGCYREYFNCSQHKPVESLEQIPLSEFAPKRTPQTAWLAVMNEVGQPLILRVSNYCDSRIKVDSATSTARAVSPSVKAGANNKADIIVKMPHVPVIETPRVLRMTLQNFNALFIPK